MTIKKLVVTIYDGIQPSSRAYKGKICLNSVSFRARLKDANEALEINNNINKFMMIACS